MGKKHICFAILFLIITCFVKNTAAYNDTVTHPDITGRAAEPANSQLDQYLKNNLGFKNGLKTLFSLDNKNKKTIVKWLRQGAELEDDPMCRATNHFHNPLLPWDQSFMSDDTTPLALIIRAYCELSGWTYANRNSNVTWGTGYLAPPPDGPKASFNPATAYAPINWDKAREYYYNALMSVSEEDRDSYFARTFNAVGHVMHLLEDVSVPAHVRNDFTSHLTFNGFLEAIVVWDYKKLVKQPFEYYVEKNPDLVTSVDVLPEHFPSFSNIRLTDFWDTEQYNGSNPSNSSSIGLSEFTNANYFSESTIPANNPTPEHSFPNPMIDDVKYQACEDYAPNSTVQKRWYISRNDKVGCDHFAVVSALNPMVYFTDSSSLNDNISSLELFLDDNVHDTYANELVPHAIGYSAGLLDYFFRGEIDMIPDDNTGYGYVVVNNTEEEMDGTFELWYDDTNDERKLLLRGNFALGTLSSGSNESSNITFTPPTDAKYCDKYILVFKGVMGQEQNAVVGKVLNTIMGDIRVCVTGRLVQAAKSSYQIEIKVYTESGLITRLFDINVSEVIAVRFDLSNHDKLIVAVLQNNYVFHQFTIDEPNLTINYNGIARTLEDQPDTDEFTTYCVYIEEGEFCGYYDDLPGPYRVIYDLYQHTHDDKRIQDFYYNNSSIKPFGKYSEVYDAYTLYTEYCDDRDMFRNGLYHIELSGIGGIYYNTKLMFTTGEGCTGGQYPQSCSDGGYPCTTPCGVDVYSYDPIVIFNSSGFAYAHFRSQTCDSRRYLVDLISPVQFPYSPSYYIKTMLREGSNESFYYETADGYESYSSELGTMDGRMLITDLKNRNIGWNWNGSIVECRRVNTTVTCETLKQIGGSFGGNFDVSIKIKEN